MVELTVPEILKMPDKLYPIITELNNKRYFLIEGGRGGGKSQAVGRFLLYLSEKYKLRVVCGRETQNSITESVYSLLTDLILSFNLFFDIFASKIVHKGSGTTMNFRGFREQGRFNIQGLEGVDIVWVDEAQAITKQTLDVLLPTIRKDNAKIFFTMNRFDEHDPVFQALHGRSDCLHIHINFHDNPFCTQALKTEAAECQLRSEKDYRHIWLGEPLGQAEDSLFSRAELVETQKHRHIMPPGYGERVAGFDIARYGSDKCACVVLQQMGALHWEEVFTDEWEHKDLNYTTGRILVTSTEQKLIKAAIDEDGIGAGPLDTLRQGRGLEYFVGFRNPTISYSDNRFYGNNRTVMAYKVKDLIMKGHLVINNAGLINELVTILYTFDHNQRRILVSKEQMRAKKIPSPNKADALFMAVSLIDNFKAKQDQQYRPNVRQYSKEDSLFGICGVK